MAYSASLFGIAIALILALPLVSILMRRDKLSSFPGPYLAKFTDLWRFIDVWQGKMQLTQVELHRKYGKAVRIGPNCVSLSDPALVKTVYGTKKIWIKSGMYRPGSFVKDRKVIDTIFSTPDEAAHSFMFKPIARLYNMSSVLHHENLVDRTLKAFLKHADKRFVETGLPCAMENWLHYFAWDVIGEITFSERFGFMDKGADALDLIHTNKRIMNYFGRVSQMPVIDAFLDKNPIVRIGPPSATTAGAFCAERYFGRLSRGEITDQEKTGPKDFLDSILAMKQNDPDFDDNLLISYLMMNFIAGSDTTAIALRAALYFVLRTPGVHEKLQKELDDAAVEIPVSWKTTQRLPYLDAVVREALRIHPAVGSVLERIVPDTGLSLEDGRYLPPGTAVGINPWVLSRDPDIYGSKVDEFIPERWLKRPDEGATTYEARLSNMKNADLGFGFGKRACYGKPIALLEIYKLIATLFAVYDMRLVDPEKEWVSSGAFFISQTDINVLMKRRYS